MQQQGVDEAPRSEQTAHPQTREALARFDALAPVDAAFMRGAWRGEGFATGHPLDGLLEAWHWHGKRFDNDEDVHPLVFSTRGGRRVAVNPGYAAPALSLLAAGRVPKSSAVGHLFQWMLPLLATRRSRARLRMISHRGVTTAAMVYDQLPIHDVFRKVDEHTVLGLMDLKGMARPFFFILRREAPATPG